MEEAMRRATDTLASGVTLFWRMLEKPGYIRLDAERVRAIVASAGKARFACATASGEGRAAEVADAIARSPLLAHGSGPVRSILCGVLSGDDLRLSEISRIADGVRDAFGHAAKFELSTVNDEATFSGRLSVVTMLFESGDGVEEPAHGEATAGARPRRARRAVNPLASGQPERGRFTNVQPTVWKGEDLDIPTFVRRSITLDI
jgi:cell division GTPase FtsZ